MLYSEVSNRYAGALFELSKEAGKQDKVFKNLISLRALIEDSKELSSFVHSQIVSGEDKRKAMAKFLEGVMQVVSVRNSPVGRTERWGTNSPRCTRAIVPTAG